MISTHVRRMIVLTIAVLVFFLVGALTAKAGGCRVVAQKVVKQQVVQQVVTPVVPVIPVTAVQVQVPTYNFSYSQQQAQAYQQEAQAQTAPQDCCQQLVMELAKLRSEIAALRGGPGVASTPPPGTGASLSVMQSRCAVCHTASRNPRGELELFDPTGKRLPLSLTTKNRIKRRVMADDMPKPEPGHPATPLTNAEKEAFFRELEQ